MPATRGATPAPRRALGLVVAALTLPLVVWAIGWQLAGWIPQGDQAIIAMKTQDVFSAHPPLLGMRSTSSVTVATAHAHHPGPMQFYLMAVPYALFGSRPLGLLVGGVLIGAAFIGIAIGQGWRVARWWGVGVAAFCVLAAQFYLGASIVLPWNVYPPMIALVATLMSAWALARGHGRLLVWFVASTSFVLQANLFYLPVVAPLVLGLSALAVARVVRRRHGPARGRPRGTRRLTRVPLRDVLLAVVVGVVCWLPSIIELFLLSPNNAAELGELLRGTVAQHPASAALGAMAGLAGIGAGAWWLTRRERLAVSTAAIAVATVATLGLGAALAAGGQDRLHYGSMAVAVPFFLVAAVALRWTRVPALAARRRRALGLAAGLVIGGAAAAVAPNSLLETGRTTEERVNAMSSRKAVDAALREIGNSVFGLPPVEVLGGGYRSSMSDTSALMLRLQTRGHPVYAPRVWSNLEDDDFRNAKNAPSPRVLVELFDDGPPRVSIPWEWPSVKK